MSRAVPAPLRRLLIVDDDVDFAVSTSRALALEGVATICAHDGAAALAGIEDDDLEIVLLDIRLGQEDGTLLATQLLARRPDLILVIMTAYASVDSAVAALKAGAYDYLRKPFFLAELMQALDRCFQLADLRRDKARIEDQMALLRQIEAASQMAAGLSHDFKNMLAVVLANLSVIDDGLPVSDRLKPYAGDAREAANTAADLVSRLMGFARRPAQNSVAIDLRHPVESSVAMLQHTICARMKLSLVLPDGPVLVSVDPRQVETAMVNLLINARDATGGGGHVGIDLSVIARGAPYARLTVADDGPGFTSEGLARGGEPLFTTKPEGTGLGLSMIRQMAVLNGGHFRIENGQPGGALVILDLPCADPLQDYGENM